jgi:predicted DNA-binding ribbon-helix-helix protein
MKRGRKSSKAADNFAYDFGEYNEENFETQSEDLDIESIVNKLDLQIPLEEIAAEENISMNSLVKCIDYLREQKVNIDTTFYGDSLNFYSANENSFTINSFDEL